VSFGAILLLSLGLAMDATAVSAARGLAAQRVSAQHVALIAVLFGGFQALMPLIGWMLGTRVGPLVEQFDHWIAFVLLGGIGGKMLWEAFHDDAEAGEEESEPFRLRALFVLGVATSIDALAAGITLPMLDAPFALTLVTIGVVTAISCALGVLAGRRFGAALGKRLDAAGGIVLIGLGMKILVEHLMAG
jgi:putative Mn2+ efflux pump MntP